MTFDSQRVFAHSRPRTIHVTQSEMDTADLLGTIIVSPFILAGMAIKGGIHLASDMVSDYRENRTIPLDESQWDGYEKQCREIMFDSARENFKEKAYPLLHQVILLNEVAECMKGIKTQYNPYSFSSVVSNIQIDKTYFKNYVATQLIPTKIMARQLRLLAIYFQRVLIDILQNIPRDIKRGDFEHVLMCHLADTYSLRTSEWVKSGIDFDLEDTQKKYSYDNSLDDCFDLVRSSIMLQESIINKQINYRSYNGETFVANHRIPDLVKTESNRMFIHINKLLNKNTTVYLNTVRTTKEPVANVYSWRVMTEILNGLDDIAIAGGNVEGCTPMNFSAKKMFRETINSRQTCREMGSLASSFASTLLLAMDIMPESKNYICKAIYEGIQTFLQHDPKKWLLPSAPHDNPILQETDLIQSIWYLDSHPDDTLNTVTKLSSRVYRDMGNLLSEQLNGKRFCVFNPISLKFMEAIPAVVNPYDSNDIGYPPIDAIHKKALENSKNKLLNLYEWASEVQ